MKTAVLGGGNGSYAVAADFTKAGHEVRLQRRNYDDFPLLPMKGTCAPWIIWGSRSLRFIFLLRTSEIPWTMQSLLFAQRRPLRNQIQLSICRRFLRDGQVIFLPPGTFGSVLMARVCCAGEGQVDVTFSKTGTLPQFTRKRTIEDGKETIAITPELLGCHPGSIRRATVIGRFG